MVSRTDPGRTLPHPPDTTKLIPFSDFIRSGVLPMTEIVEPIFDKVNEEHGTNVKPNQLLSNLIEGKS